MNPDEFLIAVGLSSLALLVGTLLVTWAVPRARGQNAGRCLAVGLCLAAGAVFVHSFAESLNEPDEPRYSNPYQEPADEYGGCPAGPRSC